MRHDADKTATDDACGIPRVQLDAYPRLCGLPVTFERLVPPSAPPEPSGRPVPPSSARRP